MTNESPKPRWKALAAVTAAAAILLVALVTVPSGSAEASIDPRQGFADLIEQVEPAVVTVEVSKTMDPQLSGYSNGGPQAEEFLRRFFGNPGMTGQPQQPRQAQGVGSGFIVDDEGYIVTNNHVIEGADRVTVRLVDEREFEAEVVGYDEQTDLALLKIDADDLTVSEFGDSDDARVGDWVVAIGNPFGLGGTATVGIVSARGRDIQSGPYDDYLQIDAPINRGNSGGPVFNTEGEVVGVNTAIFSPNGGSVGIGFAIPANMVSDIVEELKDSGAVDRGWLGVSLQNIDEEMAATLELPSTNGSLVAEVVKGSPAEKAGIEVGDVITEFDGASVDDGRELSRLVGGSDSGEKVAVTVLRGDKEVEINVQLGDAATRIAANDSEQKIKDLGMTLAPLTDDIRQSLGVDEEVSGAVVVRVDPNGVAATQGFRRGDIVIQADRQEIENPADLRNAMSGAKKKGKTSVPVLVKRGDVQRFASLPVG